MAGVRECCVAFNVLLLETLGQSHKERCHRECIRERTREQTWRKSLQVPQLEGQSWDSNPGRAGAEPLLHVPSWNWSPGSFLFRLSIHSHYLDNRGETVL